MPIVVMMVLDRVITSDTIMLRATTFERFFKSVINIAVVRASGWKPANDAENRAVPPQYAGFI